MEIFFKDKKPLLDDINPVVLGKILKIIRIAENIKKTVLAKQLGVDRTTVFFIEKGDRLPSLSYIYKFANIFRLNVDYILKSSII
ncbi:MAG: helix-turn-helix domain-containing protein [Bacilli bacterium]|nr:helix-turn-helix domain-containing protein [Bacilli bacterium]